MKLEQKHLELVKAKFEEVRKNKCNVLDEIFSYYGESIENLLFRYVISFFDSYDYLASKKIIIYDWEDFYKTLEDNLGKEKKEISGILLDKYGLAF